MRSRNRRWLFGLLGLLHALSPAAHAQAVVRNDARVATDTPEAWAMRYFAGTTLFTSLGDTARLAPACWNASLDVGAIPRLDETQQEVGFGGFKREDLNKSPVFGRLRLAVGLPHGVVAELAYTPPLAIDGTRPRDLVAAAVGKRLLDEGAFTWSMRALGQIGRVQGDITCPARLAGLTDETQNPYGCQAPSNDTFATRYYDGWGLGDWRAYASAGIVRAHLAVQVDAQVFDANDRSRLTSRSNLAWLAAGVRRDLDRHWSVGAELLYVPLAVRRPPDFAREADPLTTLRLQLRYSVD